LRNDRIGEWLWEEWDGEGFESESDESVVYVTYDNVDINEDIVKRALASCMQRDGVADSLSNAFLMIERGTVSHGYLGFIEEDKLPYVTDEFGETLDGDETDYISEATWVECSE
jgi:hypothetical protein